MPPSRKHSEPLVPARIAALGRLTVQPKLFEERAVDNGGRAERLNVSRRRRTHSG